MKQNVILPLVAIALSLAARLSLAQSDDPQRPAAQETKTQTIPPDPQRPDEHKLPQGRENPNEPAVIRLTLTPAAEPVPALKYELLPGPLERVVFACFDARALDAYAGALR